MKRADIPHKGLIKPDAALAMIGHLDETAARVNLAALALSAPLLAMREGQARREAARAAVDPHADKTEVEARAATLEHIVTARAALDTETARAQVTPVDPKSKENAVYIGRIMDGDKAADGARIIAEADGKRLTHACADNEGRFTLEVPAGPSLRLAVARSSGPIVHRDEEAVTLKAGQQAWREINLAQAKAPCDLPEDDTPNDQDDVAVPDIVGMTVARAKAALAKARLDLGAVAEQVSEPQQAGRVVVQKPKAATRVKMGSAVDVAIGKPEIAEPVPVGPDKKG